MRTITGLMLGLAPPATYARAEAVTAAALKAAFVFNFAMCTVWPDDAPAAALQVRVIGDSAVAQAAQPVKDDPNAAPH